MQIKYVGPRPEISEHGVTFKTGKEDKYVYLSVAVQILIALDKNCKDEKTYSYSTSQRTLSDMEMLDTMLKFEPTLEKSVLEEKASYAKHLDEEIEHIEHREHMNPLNKEIFLNNYKIMKEYRLQRAVNKMYYMHCIKEIVDVIKKEHIREIDAPFQEKYWHVLQTIEGALISLKSSLSCDLRIERDKENTLIAKLFINESAK
ncbi:MAG: hypothetical protein RBT59_05810 [Arcobacteraceae bacterium]|jgi:uncharacterized membrane protein YheB (UPF0754 family)|nr:hypothetical protein [Arcobacteraceae bacterium]